MVTVSNDIATSNNQTNGKQVTQIVANNGLNSNSILSDNFNRLRTSSNELLFSYSGCYQDDTYNWSNSILNGGTITYNSNFYQANTFNTNDYVLRQTKQYFPLQTGQSYNIYMSFSIPLLSTNSIYRIGYYDDINGLFFQVSNELLYVCVRSNGTDFSIAQSLWNIDPLNGVGISGINLNISNIQTLFIDLQWFYNGHIVFGFLINGIMHGVHNVSVQTIQTCKLPLRYELTSNTSTQLYIYPCSIVSNGPQKPLSLPFSINSFVGVNTTYSSILTLQYIPNQTANVIIKNINIVSLDSVVIIWQLFITNTIAYNDFIFSPVDNMSSLQYSTTSEELNASSNRVLLSGCGINNIDKDYNLNVPFSGNDLLMLAISVSTGSTTVCASINFDEIP